jgi:hypothetical protein
MKEYLKMEQNISWCMKVMFVYLKDKIKEYLKMKQKFNNIYSVGAPARPVARAQPEHGLRQEHNLSPWQRRVSYGDC